MKAQTSKPKKIRPVPQELDIHVQAPVTVGFITKSDQTPPEWKHVVLVQRGRDLFSAVLFATFNPVDSYLRRVCEVGPESNLVDVSLGEALFWGSKVEECLVKQNEQTRRK